MCLVCVWYVSGMCLVCVWYVSGMCLVCVWCVSFHQSTYVYGIYHSTSRIHIDIYICIYICI